MPVVPKDVFDRAMEQMKRAMAETANPRVQDRYAHTLTTPRGPLLQTYFGTSPATPHAPPEPEIDIEAEDDKLTS